MIIQAWHLASSTQLAARFAHWKANRVIAASYHGRAVANVSLEEGITSLVELRLVERGCLWLREGCFQLWTLDLFLRLRNDSSNGCTVLSCRVESKNSAKRAQVSKTKVVITRSCCKS